MFTDPTDIPTELQTMEFGGKGANLRRMANELGMPIPEGFTIPTEWTFKAIKDGAPNPLLVGQLNKMIKLLGTQTGLLFGGVTKPLIVSVRSGAPKSMPGMMETILNLGLNDKTVVGLAKITNERFAWDSYRRFIQMYAVTALDADPNIFNETYEAAVAFAAGGQLDAGMLKILVKQYRDILANLGLDVPQDVNEQLLGATLAVFRSWDAPKAKTYRKIENIPDDLGTAVTVQRMVFGNLNDKSGTGVVFTRDPNTGENIPFGDFLVNAQGEDVVDGSHHTTPFAAMKDIFPDAYKALVAHLATLESTFHDMCDVEFTVQDGELFVLQTRVGKRAPQAALNIALDMLVDGTINRAEASRRISEITSVVKQNTDMFSGTCVGTGKPACPGKVMGSVVFTSSDAVEAAAAGETVILVTKETNPSDIDGMAVAAGILTAKGGLVSHAAVVARGWGKPCVVGLETLTVEGNTATISGHEMKKGDTIVIDGETGEVFIKS